MARRRLAVPKPHFHKFSGQARVKSGGKHHYLGPWGSAEAEAEYQRFVADWLARRKLEELSASERTAGDLTLNEIGVAFLAHADGYYRDKAGKPTREAANVRDAIRPLLVRHGDEPAQEFGPKKLKALRQHLIALGLARTTINNRLGRILRLFRWAASEELLGPGVHQALAAVEGLRKGKTTAREPEDVAPVSDADVEAIRGLTTPQVWAMIELQRLTGMRPGEACALKGGDLDRSGPIWIGRLASHKTDHKGKVRAIAIGPKAQQVLIPFLGDDPDEFLFRPKDAAEANRRKRRANRKTKVQPSQLDRSKPEARKHADRYMRSTYGQAIARACRKAGVPVWSPNQLRHTAATKVRAEFGPEFARAVLGHASLRTTEIYAEIDLEKAVEVARKMG